MNGHIRSAVVALFFLVLCGCIFAAPFLEKRPLGTVVDVVCVVTSPGLSTRVALNAEQLERTGRTLKVHLPSCSDAVRLEFFRSLRSLVSGDQSRRLDLRIGVQLYGADGKLLHKIYLASDRTSGIFDGQAISHSDDLAKWIVTVCGDE